METLGEQITNFPLKEQVVLSEYLMLLLNADEPKAFLGCLKRIAERKAFLETRGDMDRVAAQQWQGMVDAIAQVEYEYARDAINADRRRL